MMRIGWLSVGALGLAVVTSLTASAQDKPTAGEAIIPPASPQAAAPPNPVPVPAAASPQAPTPAAPVSAAGKLSPEQLDQLLAPIALYPDQLLGQILMASTYPLQVIEAARWGREPANRALRGDALMQAMKAREWDPSVMALVPFQRVLQVMNDRLAWMRDLGAAFVGQEADVMAAVQRLRHLAMVAGDLKQTPQCHCIVSTQGDTITIVAAEREPVCIPTYNTRLAYGRWPYPAHPPVLFPVPPGVVWVPGLPVAFYPVVELAWDAPLWGWERIDWEAHHIVVDPGRYAGLAARDPGFAAGVWVHDPNRRGAVAALGVAGAGVVAARLGAERGAGAALPGVVLRGRGAGSGMAAAPAGFQAARLGRIGRARPFASVGARRGGGRFGGMRPFAMRAGPRFGGFGGGGHFGGRAEFALGGGGGPHGFHGGAGPHGGGHHGH